MTRMPSCSIGKPRSTALLVPRLVILPIKVAILITTGAGLCHAQEGTAVFLRSCVRRHSPNNDAHAPMPEEMAKMPWQNILKTLESGSMKAQGAALSVDDRRAVARYLGASGPAILPEMSGFCATGARPAKTAMSWNGWGVDDWNTGAIRWSKQAMSDMFNWDCGQPGNGGNCPDNPGDDVDFGSSAILVHLENAHLENAHLGNAPPPNSRDILVAGQKAGVVYGFDPDRNGEIVWQTRIGKGGKLGGILWGMAAQERTVFAPLSDLNRADPAAGGGLFALDAASGKVLWHAAPPKPSCLGQRGCATAQMAPPSAIPGIVFSASMDGHIRALRMADGKIVWDYDAAHDFSTVNRIPAKGGSFSATGPTIVDGMLYTTSGYPQGMPRERAVGV